MLPVFGAVVGSRISPAGPICWGSGEPECQVRLGARPISSPSRASDCTVSRLKLPSTGRRHSLGMLATRPRGPQEGLELVDDRVHRLLPSLGKRR